MQSPATTASLDRLEALGYRAWEWSSGRLRPHLRRLRYGYDNLVFVKV